MATVQSDGGGASTKKVLPTPTSDLPERRGTAPLALPIGSRKGPGTRFGGRPADDTPAKPTLTDVVRRNGSKATPTSTRTTGARPLKQAPGAPTDDALAIAIASKARRGVATTNDGRADGELNSGTNVGARDKKIEVLQERYDDLTTESEVVAEVIENLEDEIKSDEKKSDLMGTVASVAVPGLGMVSGLLGKENPVEAVAADLLNIEEDKEKLEDKQGELEAAQTQIAADIRKLENERALNFLADVAHVTNMPAPVVQVLEGSDTLSITTRSEDGIGDAAYNKESGEIVADQAVLESVTEVITELRAEGIVDGDGRILDAVAFDKSQIGDQGIGTAVLFGVHEPTHAMQDEQLDLITTTAQESQSIISTARKQSQDLPPEQRARVMAAARRDAEMHRIDALEYDSYVNQETIELQAGKQKKLFTTINPDGSLLPRADAVRNIYELQIGGAMVAGVSEGLSVADVTEGDDHDHDHDHGHEGEHDEQSTPVTTTSSWLHDLLTGGYGVPGKFTPGKFTPGGETPGKFTPGKFTPGDETPGKFTPGKFTPGSETPGKFTPGKFTPGSETPGKFTPGKFTPGDETPGKFTPGKFTPGDMTG